MFAAGLRLVRVRLVLVQIVVVSSTMIGRRRLAATTAVVATIVMAHSILLLEATARVREPRRDLVEAHARYDRQHDLLALSRVRILAVLVQPRL